MQHHSDEIIRRHKRSVAFDVKRDGGAPSTSGLVDFDPVVGAWMVGDHLARLVSACDRSVPWLNLHCRPPRASQDLVGRLPVWQATHEA